MKYQLGLLILVKLLFIIFQNIQLYNCEPIRSTNNADTSDYIQLQNAKLIKSELLIIIKNAGEFIKNLDEWAVQKTVNITKTDQLTSENVKQVENEIIQIQNKTDKLKNKLKEYIDDIDEVSNEKSEIEDDIKLLEVKFKHYIDINLRILGEFYDNYYSDIINKKDNLYNDITNISVRINEIKREKEMRKLLDECADAIKRNDYAEVIFHMKLLKNYENDLKVVIDKLYGLVSFEKILEFANEIQNINITTVIYQKIYGEIDENFYDQMKINLLKGLQIFIDKTGRDTIINNNINNIFSTLIEPWKDTIKIYVYEFIKSSGNVLNDHMGVIYEITELDGNLLTETFEEIFDEIINFKGQFALIEKEKVHDVFTSYFNAIRIIVQHRFMISLQNNSAIINLGYLAKDQLNILKGFPYFFRLPNNGAKLKSAFPDSVRNLVFSDYVCIGTNNGEYWQLSDRIIDGYKNLITITSGALTKWKIIRHNITSFEIISNEGSLFADHDYYNFGRIVYTDQNSNRTDTDAKFWELEYDNERIYIKNKLFSQFLGINYNNNFLVTLKYSRDNRKKWIIEDCTMSHAHIPW
ncbi:hypothetical protein O3M35_003474 [Rhynocoris fuscipes]|uniref:Uncharacterized protein n=1 Tax=Rhynocoris fuscipes TaxID=488301 RepID=A0AAW1CMK9_9HEMI